MSRLGTEALLRMPRLLHLRSQSDLLLAFWTGCWSSPSSSTVLSSSRQTFLACEEWKEGKHIVHAVSHARGETHASWGPDLLVESICAPQGRVPPLHAISPSFSGRSFSAKSSKGGLRLFDQIDQAATPQDLVGIFETYHLGRAPTGAIGLPERSRAVASTSEPNTSRMSPSQMTAMCGRLVDLLQGQAAAGPSSAYNFTVGRSLLSQVTAELTTRAGDLTLKEMQNMLAAWAFLEHDPGNHLRMEMLWKLRPDGGSRLRTADFKELATLTHSLQRLRWLDDQPELVEVVAAAALRRAVVGALEPSSLTLMAQTLWALKHRDRMTYSAFGEAAAPIIPGYAPTHLAALLHVLTQAKADLPPKLLHPAASRLLPLLHMLSGRELAWLAESFAEAGCMHELMFAGISDHVSHLALKVGIRSGTARPLPGYRSRPPPFLRVRDVSRLVSAFSKMDLYEPDLFNVLEVAVVAGLTQEMQLLGREGLSSNSQQTAGPLFARQMHPGVQPKTGGLLPVADPSTRSRPQMAVHGSADPTARLPPACLPADLTALALGFSKARHYHAWLFDALADHAVLAMSSYDAVQLGQLCLSMVETRHRHKLLLQAAAARALELAGGLKPARPDGAAAGRAKASNASSVHPDLHKNPHQQQHRPEDTWALIRVINCLSLFGQEYVQLLRQSLPILTRHLGELCAHLKSVEQCGTPTPGHLAWQDLALLLEPLQLQVQQLLLLRRAPDAPQLPDAGIRDEAWLAMCLDSLLLTVEVMVQSLPTYKVPVLCKRQIARSIIVLRDGGVDVGDRAAANKRLGEAAELSLGAWKLQVGQAPSNWQSSIAGHLQGLGFSDIKLDGRTSDGHFSCMLLVTILGRRIALDVCGAVMYPANAKPTPLGVQPGKKSWHPPSVTAGKLSPSSATKAMGSLSVVTFRSQAMSLRGWLPLPIPYWQWETVQGQHDEARNFLRKKITTALQMEEGPAS